jgi:hypothetical protein
MVTRRWRELRVEPLEQRDLPACLVPANTCFAVIGDYGNAGPNEEDVADLVKSWNPDFIITVGDNNYDNGAASTIDANIGQYYHEFIHPYIGSYGAGATTNRFFPALGNHDWRATGALPYRNYFTLPDSERYYDFTRGSVEFFAIDSDDHEPDGNTSASVQANWLRNELAASTATWKIVYFHHPPYSSGSAHGSTYDMQWPFQEWGASAVLSGHNHVYERIVRDGFPYFVNGLGGDDITGFSGAIAGSQKRYNGDYGAMLVDASDAQITFQFIARTRSVIDTYTIALESGPPTVTIAAIDSTAAEPGTNTGVLSVSRSGLITQPLTVSYSVGGTASPGTDYVALSGSVTIPAGYASTNIVVTAKDDSVDEPLESVVVTLSAGGSYSRSTSSTATVSITDNDPASAIPVVSISATDSSASEASSNTGQFTVTRSGSATNPMTVIYTVTGTATPGSDYTALSGTVTIPAGASVANITVTPKDDSVFESLETVIATISTSNSYTRGTATSGTVNIADDDPALVLPVVTIAATDPSASEAGTNPGKLTVTRTGSMSAPLTVLYSVGGSATAGSDYKVLTGSVVIAAGSASAKIVVTPNNDTAAEGNESVLVTIKSGTAYNRGTPNSASVIIADNDVPATSVLVAKGSVWKYLDNGSNQGTAWRGVGFSDSAWTSGAASLGYGDGDELTVVGYGPNGGDKYITTYFRRVFTVTDASRFNSLTLRLLRDDGAVVYLNGTPVLSSNMPTGAISYTTRAASSANGADENTYFETVLDAALLRNGSNVIAVELHQFDETSSDISFDLELIAS